MQDPMAAIRVTFFQECEEQLTELASGLTSMEAGTADQETINAVFRAVHSIKGGAGIFALDQLVRFAHVFETSLDKVRSGDVFAGPEILTLFFRAADMLEDIINAAKDNKLINEDKLDEAIKLFDFFGQNANSNKTKSSDTDVENNCQESEAENHKIWKIKFKPHATLYAKANEAAFLLREIKRLGEVEVNLDLSELPKLQDLDPEASYLSWAITLHSSCKEKDIFDIFEFVEDDCIVEIKEEIQDGFAPGTVITGDNGFKFEFFGPIDNETESGVEYENITENIVESSLKNEKIDNKIELDSIAKNKLAKSSAAIQDTTEKTESAKLISTIIRVDLERVDRMINLVGELVINEAMLSQRVLEAGLNRNSGIAEALEGLEHLTREIQDSVMAIRAQPVRSVFQRMPRLVRELEAMTGKQVRLTTEGEGTEVDKTIIERLSDPITHMIRNAVDHGIEAPDARIAVGKPPEGTIRLMAVHRSGRIVLEVTDDGAGINRPYVRQKAINKGLIEPDAQLSDEEIDNLIFLPGFSTAETISDISGRGVGMDVVRQSVQELGGRISISSRPGQGSTFTLSLPLTLAVLDGMVVSTHGHTLIIPLGAIIETLKPKTKDIFPLDKNLNMLALRGGYVPIVDVAYTLGYSVQNTETEKGVALLVESEAGTRAVLLVDAIHGQRQVVIKSLESNYRAVPGIAAATVMGDGRVALIVDVDVIVKNISYGISVFNIHEKISDHNGKAA